MRIANTFYFTPGIIQTLVTAVVFPFLLSLGFWQLDRGEQKERLQQAYDEQKTQAPVVVEQLMQNQRVAPYHKIILNGVFDSKQQFIRDNRILNGQPGYHILTPLKLSSGQGTVLINRGWIPLGISRNRFPPLPLPTTPVSLQAEIHIPPTGVFTLAKDSQTEHWPKLIQTIEWPDLEKSLGVPLQHFVAQLDENAEYGFKRQWPPFYAKPEKHYSYAVQWFALSLTLFIIYFVVNLHRIKP
jgi:surfeit locus 1 family protein